jgi:hypothetical protein
MQVTLARSHSQVSARPRAARGIALLMALALIAFITAAAIISLRAVATESALQAHERRGREAFFAAQAGLAEGREVVRLRLNGANTFTALIGALPSTSSEAGLPATWRNLIGWQPYSLGATDAGLGVDPGVTGNNLEMNGPDGARIDDFPTASNVRYRVFISDDNDDLSDNRDSDPNNQAWIISVGEVEGPPGTQPHRSIVRALISAGTSGGSGPPCWDEGCDDNSGG